MGPRRAIRLCRKPDDPASAIRSICAPCLSGSRPIALLRFYARADGGYLRLACAGPTRIMHRRSPVRRCSATRPDDLATLPASSFRQRSWDFHPSQLCSCSRVRIASRPRAPTCRFASNPTPIILSGGQPLNTTPTTFATGRGRCRGSWVFSSRASRSHPVHSGRAVTAMGLRLSQVFGHRKHRHASRRFSRPPIR